MIFSIGEPSAAAPVAADDVDWTVRAGVWLTKIAIYVGLFIGAGGALARTVLMPGTRSGGRIAGLALGLGTAGAGIGLAFQGLDALGATVGSVADPAIWRAGYETSFGNTVAVATAAFAAGALGLLVPGWIGAAAAVASVLLAALAPALSGHASAANPQWLMRPTVFLHALCIAVWIGALAPLGLALRRDESASLRGLARFSRLMPWVLAMLIATGIAIAVVQVEQPSALFATAYGRVFLGKLVLLAVLLALAAHNRWRLTPIVDAGNRTAAHRLMRSIAIETALAVLIFATAAMWRFTPPPRVIAAAAAVPAQTHMMTAKAMADVTVSPGHAGEVSVSAIILTAEFGPLDAKEVTFVLSNPSAGIEPFARRAEKPGDGTWRADGVVLPLPGLWTLRVDILVNDFELASVEGEVTIRP